MRKIIGKLALVAAAIATVQACGGGGGGNGSTPGPTATNITDGVVVDPYILGAVLQELTPDRKVVQESSASDANGAFTFGAPLTKGNLLATVVKGLHNGRPYANRLERKIDVTDGKIVVSPITTLLAGRQTPAQVAAMLTAALGTPVAEKDLTLDPMAVGTGDRSLLAAAMAVSAALEISRGNVASDDLDDLVAAVAPKIEEVLAAGESLSAVSSAAAAVAEYIARNCADSSEAQGAADLVDDSVIANLVAGAESGVPVSLDDALEVAVVPGTVASRLAGGFAALEAALVAGGTDGLLTAVEEFSAADALVAFDTTVAQNDADKARFFGALARVALLLQPYSDATSNGLNDLGDLLDGFGMAGDRGTFDPGMVLTCTPTYYTAYDGQQYVQYYAGDDCDLKPLAEDSPRTGAVQAFLANQLGAGLNAAIAKLDLVSEDFSAQLTDGARVVEFDRTDAFFVKAVAHAMLAFVQVQQAYNLDVDVDAIQRKRADKVPPYYGVDQFLAEYPSFFRLVNATSLPLARADAISAIHALQAALDGLRAEGDDQADDFIRIANESCWWNPTTYVYSCTVEYNPASMVDDFVAGLATVEAVATSTGPHTLTMGTPETDDDVVVNPSKFFVGGVDVRALAPASFSEGLDGDRPGQLPDTTFGGVLASSPVDLTRDGDLDGSPDFFGGYTIFGPWLRGKGYIAGGWGMPLMYGVFELGSTGDGFTWTEWTWAGAEGAPQPGTWSSSDDVLTFTFASPVTLAIGDVKTVVVRGNELSDGDSYFSASVEYRNESGAPIGGEYLHFSALY